MAMNQDLIARILARSRSGSPDASAAPQMPAPMPQTPPGMDAPPVPALQNQQMPVNPFAPNPGLEQAAAQQGNDVQLHPIVKQIMQHLGLLNLVRNRALTPMVDPSQQTY